MLALPNPLAHVMDLVQGAKAATDTNPNGGRYGRVSSGDIARICTIRVCVMDLQPQYIIA
jgi:hypothetical protein